MSDLIKRPTAPNTMPPPAIMKELKRVLQHNDDPRTLKVQPKEFINKYAGAIRSSMHLNHICRKYLKRKGFWAP